MANGHHNGNGGSGNGRSADPAFFLQEQELHSLSVEYDQFKTTYTHKYRNRKKYEEKDKGMITAFISGTIQKVFVKTGQKIKTGEKLLILEAMKMNNLIVSPFDGTVAELNVAEKDHVKKDFVLVRIN